MGLYQEVAASCERQSYIGIGSFILSTELLDFCLDLLGLHGDGQPEGPCRSFHPLDMILETEWNPIIAPCYFKEAKSVRGRRIGYGDLCSVIPKSPTV